MAYEGFELSEKLKVPVMIRITTRLSHSRAGVETRPLKNRKQIKPIRKIQFSLFYFHQMQEKDIKDCLVCNRFNGTRIRTLIIQHLLCRKKINHLGIIACGIAYNYLMENFP
ncbi:MAG: hypothetical protein MZV64_35930 [Ignavibacteriales bacterium]|nr:hypothetical protein [Ignavibacteriales bacterium]